ncbi:DivIVA domain-containing protein [Micromonospora sp. NBC_01655]|uniref:DivIVA domain-containing protein n=1 Tax=Micromonospora sp. NBC_01655 TaxID=2975983 RepID=UPI00225019F6|nr:DivIVA domain-containing protein [Micromonospora sp. NBC_01655]MCX4471945.1 DivIVA domain-containing protein [Micromonospora sp. NBC_01655]
MEPGVELPGRATGERLSTGDHRTREAAGEGGTVYQSRRNLLTPAEIRWQEFPMTKLGRRGLDPEAVGRFLRRVEADMDVLYQEVVTARDEARYHRDIVTELRAERRRPHEPWPQRPRNEYRRPPIWPPYSPRRQGCHRQPEDESGDD